MNSLIVKYLPFEDQVVEIPDSIKIHEIQPKNIQSRMHLEELFTARFKSPTGPLFNELYKDKQRQCLLKGKKNPQILILVDDNTRVTPVPLLLNYLFKEFRMLQIHDSDITILVCGGSHRLMTSAELDQKTGNEFMKRVRVIQHNWQNNDELVLAGTINVTPEIFPAITHNIAIPLMVNRLLLSHDLIISCGNLVPHEIAGFSGGYKMILPGASTQKTVEQVHWLSTYAHISQRLGSLSNQIRKVINLVEKIIPIHFLINTILNANREIVDIVMGDAIKAHAAGCQIAMDVYGSKVSPAEIVIADSIPEQTDFWTASKALLHGAPFVKKGGILIVCASCPEGICPTHPNIVKYGYRSPSELEMDILNKDPTANRLTATHCANIWEVLQHCSVFLVNSGISESDLTKLGINCYRTLTDAVTNALKVFPNVTRIIHLHHGSELMNIL